MNKETILFFNYFYWIWYWNYNKKSDIDKPKYLSQFKLKLIYALQNSFQEIKK